VNLIPLGVIPPTTKGLIFDCDGTLADTMPLHAEAWKEHFKELGINWPSEFFSKIKGVPTENIIAQFNHEFGYDIDEMAFSKKQDQLAYNKMKRAKPIEPVIEIVQKYQNRLPMAVASSGIKKNVLFTLEVIGIKAAFNHIITIEDVIRAKPAPDIFLKAAQAIDVAPEHCLVFEDGDVGLKAAERAGMWATDVRLYID